MASVPSWVWPAAGWVLLVCGAYLVVLGRVRLKPRRGRLCRGCGYDMAGLTSLQCPECGRVARSERELQRRRPGLWFRALGVVLLLVAPVVPRTPKVVKHGWAGGVPDWVLVVVAPREDPWTGWLNAPGRYAQPTPVVGTTYEKASRSLLAEVSRRVDDNEISKSATEYYLRRVHAETLGYVDTNLLTPAFWPRGEGSVPAWFSVSPSAGGFGLGGFTVMTPTIEDVDEKTGRVEIALLVSRSQRTFRIGQTTRRVDFALGTGELMEPVQSPELDSAVGAVVRPTIALRAGGEGDLLVFGTTDTRTLPCFSVYECTLSVDGKALVSQTFSFYPSGSPTDFSNRVKLTAAQAAAIAANPESAEVELRGKPEAAIGLYRAGWRFDRSGQRPQAWSGTVRVKPTFARRAEPGSTAKPPAELVEPSR